MRCLLNLEKEAKIELGRHLRNCALVCFCITHCFVIMDLYLRFVPWKLIIYVYDKQHVIHDVDNFIRALERDKETSGKEVRVYVEQIKELI